MYRVLLESIDKKVTVSLKYSNLFINKCMTNFLHLVKRGVLMTMHV